MAARVVLIVGGAGGMGRATARRLAGPGVHLALADLDEAGLAAAASALAGGTATVSTHRLEVRDPAACRAVVDDVAALAGGLDVLVNAAGVWVEGPSEAATEAEWDRTVDVNLKGTFFTCAAAIPHLAARRGCIVNVASDAGLVGNAGAAIYCASKGGVVLLTKALAVELAPRGVRVNALCPSDVETPMLAFQADRYGRGDPEGYRRALLEKYPQGSRARFIQPEEVAAAVAWMCSPEAGPLSGAAISLDFAITAGY
jgi:NAD(P)-dependent dehydrogenase (short-subunit alcohol dehydrogenase family)